MKRCSRCGKVKPLDEFPINVTRRSELTPTIYRKRACKVCEVERRLAKKQANRFADAFDNRRRRHASSTGYTVAQLKAMGWDDRRPREMEAQFRHGFCPTCIDDDGTVHYFRDMTQGLAELTIDIVDPSKPPVWPGNVQWLCMTCNRAKQKRSGLETGLERVMVRQWEADERGEPVQLNIFDVLDAS